MYEYEYIIKDSIWLKFEDLNIVYQAYAGCTGTESREAWDLELDGGQNPQKNRRIEDQEMTNQD